MMPSPRSSPPSSPPPPFVAAVLAFVRREALLPPGTRVLVGVSGGADSMGLMRVLLDLRETLAIEVSAAHLDHATRSDSAEDARFVADWAERWGVELTTERLAPRPPAERPPSEATLREARFEFLLRLAATEKAVLAVGQHADDRLETFLAQLIRGAGPRGLSLPRARREDGVIRPLLESSAEEIRAFLVERGIPWREDPGNRDDSNLRSRLRRDVVPLLRRENPSIARTVARTADLMASIDDYLRSEGSAALDDLTTRQLPGELALDGPRGRPYHPLILAAALREAARRFDFDPAFIGFEPFDRIVRAWKEGRRLALDLPGGPRIEVEPAAVRVVVGPSIAPGPEEQSLSVPGAVAWPGGRPESPHAGVHLKIEAITPPADARAASGPDVAWLDADRIEGPLRVRARRAGDRLRPLGAPGSVKVHDLFVDRKIPRAWRDRVPLVVDSSGVLWIPGFRVDERVRITGETRRALRLEAAPATREP